MWTAAQFEALAVELKLAELEEGGWHGRLETGAESIRPEGR
jgi:hypothetical protein